LAQFVPGSSLNTELWTQRSKVELSKSSYLNTLLFLFIDIVHVRYCLKRFRGNTIGAKFRPTMVPCVYKSIK